METLRYPCFWLLFAIVCLCGVRIGHSGEEDDSDKEATNTNQAIKQKDVQFFSLDSSQDLKNLRRMRRAAIEECTRTLEAYREKRRSMVKDRLPSWDDTRLACLAASLLGEMRASDERAIQALCDNIDLVPAVITLPDRDPLGSRVAASALVEIGNKAVFNGVVARLKTPLKTRELTLFTITLKMISTNEMALQNLRSTEANELRNVQGEERKHLERNIKQIREWLEQPEVFSRVHSTFHDGKNIGDY